MTAQSDRGEQRRRRARRAVAGLEADAAGKAFEALIDNELEGERRAGRITWHERHQPLYRCVGPGVYVPVRKGKADHGGMFAGGLAFAIEDKSRIGSSLPRSALLEGEVEHLEATAAGGGLALLAVELRSRLDEEPQRFVMPWDRVVWRPSGRGESLSLVDLRAWPMPPVGFLGTFVAWCRLCRAYRLRQHRVEACCWKRAGV